MAIIMGGLTGMVYGLPGLYGAALFVLYLWMERWEPANLSGEPDPLLELLDDPSLPPAADQSGKHGAHHQAAASEAGTETQMKRHGLAERILEAEDLRELHDALIAFEQALQRAGRRL